MGLTRNWNELFLDTSNPVPALKVQHFLIPLPRHRHKNLVKKWPRKEYIPTTNIWIFILNWNKTHNYHNITLHEIYKHPTKMLPNHVMASMHTMGHKITQNPVPLPTLTKSPIAQRRSAHLRLVKQIWSQSDHYKFRCVTVFDAHTTQNSSFLISQTSWAGVMRP